jgi:septum formation protein
MRSLNHQVHFADVTTVHFQHLDEQEIAYYVDHYLPLDKAGAYGVQDWIGYVAVERIEGSFYNVMGLPLHRIYEALRGWPLPK